MEIPSQIQFVSCLGSCHILLPDGKGESVLQNMRTRNRLLFDGVTCLSAPIASISDDRESGPCRSGVNVMNFRCSQVIADSRVDHDPGTCLPEVGPQHIAAEAHMIPCVTLVLHCYHTSIRLLKHLTIEKRPCKHETRTVLAIQLYTCLTNKIV